MLRGKLYSFRCYLRKQAKEASVVSSNQYLRKIMMNLYKCILKRSRIPLNKNMIASWNVGKKGIWQNSFMVTLSKPAQSTDNVGGDKRLNAFFLRYWVRDVHRDHFWSALFLEVFIRAIGGGEGKLSSFIRRSYNTCKILEQSTKKSY